MITLYLNTKFQIVIDQSVTIPSSIKGISIYNCPYVDFSQTQLATFNMTSLAFTKVDHLRIASNILRKVKVLVIMQVEKFDYTDGFKQMEADTVSISHVNFPVGATFHPLSIRSVLHVDESNFIGVSMKIDSQPSTHRVVSLQNNVFDRVSFSITSSTFSLMGNRFVQLLAAGPMDTVAYSSTLSLRNNTFGTASKAILLPDISSTGQFYVFESKDKVLPVDSQRWLEHFNFEFTDGATHISLDQTVCIQPDTNRAICPNVSTYLRLFSSLERKSATVSINTIQKLQNERQAQGKSNASAVNKTGNFFAFYCSLFVVYCSITNRF